MRRWVWGSPILVGLRSDLARCRRRPRAAPGRLGCSTSVAVAKAVVSGTRQLRPHAEPAFMADPRRSHIERLNIVQDTVEFAILSAAPGPFAYRRQPHLIAERHSGPRPNSPSCAAHRATHSSCRRKRDHCGSRTRLVVTVWSRIGHKKAVLSAWIGTARARNTAVNWTNTYRATPAVTTLIALVMRFALRNPRRDCDHSVTTEACQGVSRSSDQVLCGVEGGT
jgi:hypothetical protein